MDLDPEDYEALGWGSERLEYEYAVHSSRRAEVKVRADKAYQSTPRGREVKRRAQRAWALKNKDRRRHYERTSETYKAAHRAAALRYWHTKGKLKDRTEYQRQYRARKKAEKRGT